MHREWLKKRGYSEYSEEIENIAAENIADSNIGMPPNRGDD